MARSATATIRACDDSCGFSAMKSCNTFLRSSTVDTSVPTEIVKKRTRRESWSSPTPNSGTPLSKRTTAMATKRDDQGCIVGTSSNNSTALSVVESPVEFLKELFSRNEITIAWMEQQRLSNQDYAFSKPSSEELANFDMVVVKAVREGNITQTKKMLLEGRKFDACNRFGESLIHMACRRGDKNMVEFLLDDAHVDPNVCDDFGRRPLHDALWTSKPSLDVVGILLHKVPPSMFMSEDVRGHTPFHYARREHWPIWVAFLKENQNILLRRASMVSTKRLLDEATQILA